MLNRFKISPSQCSHQVFYPLSAVQSNTIPLKQCLVESWFDVMVLTLHRQNAESVQLGANIGYMISLSKQKK